MTGYPADMTDDSAEMRELLAALSAVLEALAAQRHNPSDCSSEQLMAKA
jgi:hypothetical protein